MVINIALAVVENVSVFVEFAANVPNVSSSVPPPANISFFGEMIIPVAMSPWHRFGYFQRPTAIHVRTLLLTEIASFVPEYIVQPASLALIAETAILNAYLLSAVFAVLAITRKLVCEENDIGNSIVPVTESALENDIPVIAPHWISVPSGILQYPLPLLFVTCSSVPVATPFSALLSDQLAVIVAQSLQVPP